MGINIIKLISFYTFFCNLLLLTINKFLLLIMPICLVSSNHETVDKLPYETTGVSSHYIFTIASFLFIIGLLGLLFRNRNFLLLLLKVELMFLGLNFAFIGLGVYFLSIDGFVFSLLLLGIVTAETVLGLSLFIFIFSLKKDDVMREIIFFENDLFTDEKNKENKVRMKEKEF